MTTILPSSLTADQISRCCKMAGADAAHWIADAAAGTLPNIETMQLDWHIDDDLREAGVDSEMMQRLSFEIARAAAASDVWICDLIQHKTEYFRHRHPTRAAALADAMAAWQQNCSHPDFTSGGENHAVWRVYRELPDGGQADVTEFHADAR